MIRRWFESASGEVRVFYDPHGDAMDVSTKRAPTWIWSPPLRCIRSDDDPKGSQ